MTVLEMVFFSLSENTQDDISLKAESTKSRHLQELEIYPPFRDRVVPLTLACKASLCKDSASLSLTPSESFEGQVPALDILFPLKAMDLPKSELLLQNQETASGCQPLASPCHAARLPGVLSEREASHDGIIS